MKGGTTVCGARPCTSPLPPRSQPGPAAGTAWSELLRGMEEGGETATPTLIQPRSRSQAGAVRAEPPLPAADIALFPPPLVLSISPVI